MRTLCIIFNQNKDKVLLCRYYSEMRYGFPGDDAINMEMPIQAGYRALREQLSIFPSSVDLLFVRQESVSTIVKSYGTQTWNVFITTGVLQQDIELPDGDNKYYWIDTKDCIDLLIKQAYGNGIYYTYFEDAAEVLGIKIPR